MGLVQGVPQRILVGNLNQIGCFIIFIPAFSPIVGGSSDWLSFYGSYIGLVIASLITLYVLYKQLQHNHEDNEKTRRDNQAVNEKMTASAQNIELRTGETVVAR